VEVSPHLVQELAGFQLETFPSQLLQQLKLPDLAVDDSIELMTSAMASLQALSDHQASF